MLFLSKKFKKKIFFAYLPTLKNDVFGKKHLFFFLPNYVGL